MTKSILVPLFGIDSDVHALRAAALAAVPFGSHLDCLHVRPGPREIAYATSSAAAAGVISQQLWDALEEEGQMFAKRARTAFDTFRRQFDFPVCDHPSVQSGVTIAFREVLGEPFEQTAFAGRTRELVVLSRGESPLAPTAGQIGSVLMRCGRPVLLIPRNEAQTLGTTVAIAWKDSAESARAVLAAMPFVAKAKTVVILSAAEGGKEQIRPEGAQQLASELKWHGADPEIKSIGYDNHGVTHAILNAAAQSGADLLVMGAYGHNRLQEFVLGGLTRGVLESAQLPVFLFH